MKAYLELEEIERLEQAAEYLRDRLLIRLLFHLGCRISEVLGIKTSGIDFKQGLVTIEHLKQRIKLTCPECSARLSKGHKFCPVCGRKVEKAVADEKEHRKFRVLPLDSVTMGMLKEYLSRSGAKSKSDRIFDLSRHRAWQIVKDWTAAQREALRNALEGTKNYVGVSGIYNLSPTDHCGLGIDSLVIVKVEDGKWKSAE